MLMLLGNYYFLLVVATLMLCSENKIIYLTKGNNENSNLITEINPLTCNLFHQSITAILMVFFITSVAALALSASVISGALCFLLIVPIFLEPIVFYKRHLSYTDREILS